MRFNLQLTYWCLVSITIISSCFLFLVVASESSARIIAQTAEAPSPAAAASTASRQNAEDDVVVVGKRPDRNDEAKSGVNVIVGSKVANKFIKVKKDISAKFTSPLSRNQANLVHSQIPSVRSKVHDKESSTGSDAESAHPPPPPPPPGASVRSLPLPDSLSPRTKFDDGEETNRFDSDDAGKVFSEAILVPVSVNEEYGGLGEHETSTSRGSGSIEWESVSPKSTGASSHSSSSLPDISAENPTVIPLNEITSTDLLLNSGSGGNGGGGTLEQHTIDSVIVSSSESNIINQTEDATNETKSTESNQKANDQIEKINDSGGLIPPQPPDSDEIQVASDAVVSTPMPKASPNATVTHEVNLTAEEVPIPVFSEWAQKQMEAEEKQQLEQDVVNSSTQRKNQTTGSKLQPSKLRTKNYASPDCGAKIIASNSDAQNTGAVLTSSKDEYMLSPCTNRIWFVVELCEAIQAEKIDLANFELFSSSPKNFTVAVSNRFPTRDWSNVGRFIADDKRTVQTFDLHPHLFGKFVRVDIHSHYNSEHFCPVSLFRVYGTSEFEAFETEDRADDLDEYDDDITDQTHQKHENNLFKSASDAVLSIVKKAAEVLVKTNSNRTAMEIKSDKGCFTPSSGEFACNECKDTSLAARVNYILSCKHSQLLNMLRVERLKSDIQTSQICAKRFSVNLNSHLDCKTSGLNEKSSYFLSLLPDDYVGALCMLLANRKRVSLNDSSMDVNSSDGDPNGEVSLNLTIDKNSSGGGGSFGSLDKLPDITEDVKRRPNVEDEFLGDLSLQIPPPPLKGEDDVSSTERSFEEPVTVSSETLDINIYNLPEGIEERLPSIEAPPGDIVKTDEQKTDELTSDGSFPTRGDLDVPTIVKPSTPMPATSSEDSAASWDNLDTLLSEGTASTGGVVVGSNQGTQQRIPSGPHSESVFIRLNNRIKALERNMSLSGQYLEELSRRYKKQVEELQLSLTKTVRALEDQNRRHSEQERELLDKNALLKDELEEVSLRVHACIILIIFVGSFMILLTIVGVVCYRAMTRNLSPNSKQMEKRKTTQKKLNRRKSFDDFSDASTGKQKVRRPSEEAMLILKDCTAGNSAPESDVKVRQRKVSVFYGRKASRKGEKRSWPEVSQPGVFNPGIEDLPPAEPVNAVVLEDEEYDQFNASESDSVCTSERQQAVNGKPRKFTSLFNGRAGKKTKKNNTAFKRQESAPSDIGHLTTGDSFDEKLILDEDEIENFIPGADLAYNEFMPDGPSGYHINDGAVSASSDDKRKNNKKTRRLSSPAFFKSPFSKSSKKSTPHESTSWEWYWSKKTSSASASSTTSSQNIVGGGSNGGSFLKTTKVNGTAASSSHNGQPSPASSLSEILPNSGQGSSDNSFRILEEAINTSTLGSAAAMSLSSNGNSGGGSHSGSSAGSNRSSKKSHTFNKLFKKVF